jgi:hypothetical protein
VEVFRDEQVALCHLEGVPEMLAISEPKKKFNEVVQLLLGGSEAVSAEVLAAVSSSLLCLWNKKGLLKRLGASSSE